MGKKYNERNKMGISIKKLFLGFLYGIIIAIGLYYLLFEPLGFGLR